MPIDSREPSGTPFFQIKLILLLSLEYPTPPTQPRSQSVIHSYAYIAGREPEGLPHLRTLPFPLASLTQQHRAEPADPYRTHSTP